MSAILWRKFQKFRIGGSTENLALKWAMSGGWIIDYFDNLIFSTSIELFQKISSTSWESLLNADSHVQIAFIFFNVFT